MEAGNTIAQTNQQGAAVLVDAAPGLGLQYTLGAVDELTRLRGEVDRLQRLVDVLSAEKPDLSEAYSCGEQKVIGLLAAQNKRVKHMTEILSKAATLHGELRKKVEEAKQEVGESTDREVKETEMETSKPESSVPLALQMTPTNKDLAEILFMLATGEQYQESWCEVRSKRDAMFEYRERKEALIVAAQRLVLMEAENLRLFDLVRHQRHELLKEDLITMEEYGELMTDPRADGAGSPSRQRLETYDEMRKRIADLESRLQAESQQTNDAVEALRLFRSRAYPPREGDSITTELYCEADKKALEILSRMPNDAVQVAKDNATKANLYDTASSKLFQFMKSTNTRRLSCEPGQLIWDCVIEYSVWLEKSLDIETQMVLDLGELAKSESCWCRKYYIYACPRCKADSGLMQRRTDEFYCVKGCEGNKPIYRKDLDYVVDGRLCLVCRLKTNTRTDAHKTVVQNHALRSVVDDYLVINWDELPEFDGTKEAYAEWGRVIADAVRRRKEEELDPKISANAKQAELLKALDLGIVYDGLIMFRQDAIERKKQNAESTSDERVTVCEFMLRAISAYCAQDVFGKVEEAGNG